MRTNEQLAPVIIAGLPEREGEDGCQWRTFSVGRCRWRRVSVVRYPDGVRHEWEDEATRVGESYVAVYVNSARPDLRIEDEYLVTLEEIDDAPGTYHHRVVRDLRLMKLDEHGNELESTGVNEYAYDINLFAENELEKAEAEAERYTRSSNCCAWRITVDEHGHESVRDEPPF